jgi:hypothetical protein
MNFALAIICFSGAIALFGYQAVAGTEKFRIIGTDLSAGWMLLLLAAWNFVRWYSSQSLRAARYAPPPPVRRRPQGTEELEYNPAFDFNNPSPPDERVAPAAPPSPGNVSPGPEPPLAPPAGEGPGEPR